MTAYTTTSLFDSTLPLMMFSVEQTSLTQGHPIATSCSLPMMRKVLLFRRIRIIFCMHGSLVDIMQTWFILGLACVILRLAALIFCGCDGLRLLTQGLQDGVLPSWTRSAFHLWIRIILSVLWIQKMSCVAATSYPLSQKENDTRMGLASHTVPRTVMITINILLAGGFIA